MQESAIPEILLLDSFREQFRFLWAINVKGFDYSKHCQACLKGKKINLGDGDVVEIKNVEVGDLIYLCGVSRSWEWAENFHLVGRYTGRSIDMAAMDGYRGGVAVMMGFKPFSFDDKAARSLFPERDESFLTCRNFQFGAHVFGRQ